MENKDDRIVRDDESPKHYTEVLVELSLPCCGSANGLGRSISYIQCHTLQLRSRRSVLLLFLILRLQQPSQNFARRTLRDHIRELDTAS